MTINQSGWRPTAPESGESAGATFTGNRALMLEEPLLFEIGSVDSTGVDLASARSGSTRLGGLDTPVPFSPPLEDAYRPNAQKIHDAAVALARY